MGIEIFIGQTWVHGILIQHILVFSFLLEKSIMDGVYVIFILVEHHLSFFFYFYILEELCFMGHVLPFGQMSFWGATVITNLLSPFPSLVEWIYCLSFSTPISSLWFCNSSSFYLHFLSS